MKQTIDRRIYTQDSKIAYSCLCAARRQECYERIDAFQKVSSSGRKVKLKLSLSIKNDWRKTFQDIGLRITSLLSTLISLKTSHLRGGI
jgi:hypothetical protein